MLDMHFAAFNNLIHVTTIICKRFCLLYVIPVILMYHLIFTKINPKQLLLLDWSALANSVDFYCIIQQMLHYEIIDQ